MAVWEDICDAVVTSLNAASLSQSFTAERKYRPPHNLTDITDETEPRVYVIPAQRSEFGDVPRARVPNVKRTYTVAIDVWKYIADPDTVANVDTWMLLVEEIEDHLQLIAQNSMSTGRWYGSSNDSPFDADALHEANTFHSTLLVEYRVST